MAAVELDRGINFVSGTLGAQWDELRLSCRNIGVVGVQLTGSWVGSVQVCGSLDGNTWVPIPYTTGSSAPTTSGITSNALMQVFTQFFDYLSIQCSAYTSGTIRVYARGMECTEGVVTVNQPSLGGGTNLVGDVGIQIRTVAGPSTLRIVTGASGIIKASAGKLVSYDLMNLNAAVRYLQIYNKTTAGVPGTDTPVYVIPIPANNRAYFSQLAGLYTAATGLSWAITTDAAGATIGASGDIVGSLTYA